MIHHYGWSNLLGPAFGPYAAHGYAPARVLVQQRGAYLVASASGEHSAHLSGRLMHLTQQGDYPVVGDWVALGSDEGTIQAVLPRRTAFVRKAAGKAQRPQVIAANIDLALLVLALTNDFNLRRLERYLAVTWQSGARPVVVLTKADLCDDVQARAAEAQSVASGCAVFTVSAITGEGLATLAAEPKPGQTNVLLGSSGAGKSTLVNALAGRELMATGSVSGRDGRGRHTTTHRELVLLPSGLIFLDTPGMRELGMMDSDEGVSTAFKEIESLARRCRFRNCGHGSEPGCAVVAALENGSLDAGRWNSYQKLRRELAHQDRKEDRLARETERKRWIAITKHQRARRNSPDNW